MGNGPAVLFCPARTAAVLLLLQPRKQRPERPKRKASLLELARRELVAQAIAVEVHTAVPVQQLWRARNASKHIQTHTEIKVRQQERANRCDFRCFFWTMMDGIILRDGLAERPMICGTAWGKARAKP